MSRLRQIRALLTAWLTIDFFGKSRRLGKRGSGTLTTSVFTQGSLSYGFALLNFPPEQSPTLFAAGTLAMVGGFTMLAMLGELQDQLGHAADRDLVLASPITKASFFLARGLHVCLFLVIFNVGLAIPPALLSIWTTGRVWAPVPYIGLSIVFAATLTCAFQIPVVLAQRLRGQDFAASLAALLRALLTGGVFLGLLIGLRTMISGPNVFPGGMAAVEWLPPYWFAEVFESVCGGPAASARGLWLTLAIPPLVGISLLLVALLPDRSHSSRRSGKAHAWWMHHPVPLTRPEHGLFVLVVRMLARERSFRLRALPLLGLPAAIVAMGLAGGIAEDQLPYFLAVVHILPLAYLPFLLAFLPYAEGFQASWLIEANLGDPAGTYRRAVATAFAVLMVPVQAILFGIDVWQRGPIDAAITTAIALGVTWAVLPHLVRQIHTTCFSLDPEEFAIPPGLGGLAGLGMVLTVTAIAIEALPGLARTAAAIALVVFGIATLSRPARRLA